MTYQFTRPQRLRRIEVGQANNYKYGQRGQTLIETVIAIFILVSGISAAVGLAIYALSSSQNVAKQIVAVGLAREGIEAIKNMRDTNWLKDSAIDTNCYNPASGANDAKCYQSWLTQRSFPGIAPYPIGEDLDPPASPTNHVLALLYDDTFFYTDSWLLYRRPHIILGSNCDSFSLDFKSNPDTFNLFEVIYGQGFYRPRCTGTGSSGFYRQIVLSKDDGVAQYGSGASNPFNKNTGSRLLVISRVWWTDKKCPASANWPGLGRCSLELQTYLTNWKNY